MRVAVVEVGVEADDAEQLLHASVALASSHHAEVVERLRDDVADRHARVQGRKRVLEDHLQLPAVLAQLLAPELRQLDVTEKDLARRHRKQLCDEAGERWLAPSRFADRGPRPSLTNLEADVIYGMVGGAQPRRGVVVTRLRP